jgi:hypothetical protein
MVTLTVLEEYPPGLPGNPNPQQHILAPDPPAPHISMVAVPVPGDIQHTPQWKLVPIAVPGV